MAEHTSATHHRRISLSAKSGATTPVWPGRFEAQRIVASRIGRAERVAIMEFYEENRMQEENYNNDKTKGE